MSPTPTGTPTGVPMFQKLYNDLQVGKISKFLLWTSHYIKTHEVFLGAILALALVWGVSGKITDVITAHDQRKYNAAETARQSQANANAALAKQNADLAAQYQIMAQQAQEQNAKLEQANVALATALQKQKQTDAALPPTDLAARIEKLASLPVDSVKPQPGNTFSVTDAGAVGIAQTLENVPVLQETLANTQQEKLATVNLLTQQTARVDSLNATVAGKTAELAAADKACKAEVKLVKDNATKGKRKWFIAGYVAGLATRGIVKIFGGV